jgi:hypothetical protein
MPWSGRFGLPAELLGEALEAANSIRSGRARGHALAAVNPALPPELTDRALSYAVAVEFEPSRADALTALVPALPGSRPRSTTMERGLTVSWSPA